MMMNFKEVDLSLVMATRRWDGLDITLNHAKRQRFSGSWEFVLVDEFRNERQNLVEVWAKEHNINLLHVRPKTKKDINGNPLPRTTTDYGNAFNTGLLYANGEIVVFTDDFMGFKPDFIQNHYDFLKKAGEEFCCLGPIYFIDYIPFEKRPDDITTFGCERFVPRFNCNTDEGRTHNGFPLTGEMNYRQSNVGMYLKNYIKVNGYDERFDAGGFTEEKRGGGTRAMMMRASGRALGIADNDMCFRLYDAGVYFHMEDSVPAWHMSHTMSTSEGTRTPTNITDIEEPHCEIHSLATDPDFWTKFLNLPVHFNLLEERRKLRG